MIDSPWKSTTFKQHRLDDLVSELMLAKANGRGIIPDGDNIFIVSPYGTKVPVFNLPLTTYELGERNKAGDAAVYIDGRTFLKVDPRVPNGVLTNNQTQYDFNYRVAELTSYWIAQPQARKDLMRSSDLPAKVFIAWIAGAITKLLGLDEDTAARLRVLTGIYYAHLYHDAAEASTENGKSKIAALVQRWTSEKAPIALPMAMDATYMLTLVDYINQAKALFPQNTRVNILNVGLLVMQINKSWFGFGKEDILAASLEYPPIFLGLTEAACNSKVWRKTGLGLLVERFDQADAGKKFSSSLSMTVGRTRYTGR